MTDADKPAFLEAIAKLAVALREKEPDVVQMRVYFESLMDLDIELVQMAATELAKRANWFPKTAEWREAVTALERQRLDDQRSHLRKLHLIGVILCADCQDTGFAETDGWYSACACRKLRRLEILGRRPLPALPEPLPIGDSGQSATVEAMAASLAESRPMTRAGR